MIVYLLYIDLQLQGIYKNLDTASKLLDHRKKESNFFKDDNWIDTYNIKED